jgi:protein-S-isoprenylcysteine O-methyltransferase Ste14
MLLLLTWCACIALSALTLWNTLHGRATLRTWAGVSVFWAGIALWLWGRAALGAHFAQSARAPAILVTHGPFRFVRHPLYLATTIACLGQAWAGGSILAGILWGTIVLILAVRARREEHLLRQAFGPVWRAYESRTRRILP